MHIYTYTCMHMHAHTHTHTHTYICTHNHPLRELLEGKDCVTCIMRHSPELPRWSILNPVPKASEVAGATFALVAPLQTCRRRVHFS